MAKVEISQLKLAVSAVLEGRELSKVASEFDVTTHELSEYVQKLFPTDDDRYGFLEDSMVANAMLASKIFQEKYTELSALDAAKAAGMFAGKALEIKKGRNDGFKTPPIQVGILISLKETLKNLNTPPDASPKKQKTIKVA